MTSRITYFAYGSNLSQDQMLRRCPTSSPIGLARLDGWRLAFGGHSLRWGGATASLKKSPGDYVDGVLYSMPQRDLLTLDGHEGHPYAYRRRRMRVFDETGRGRYAQVYIKELGNEKHPAGPYLGLMVRAYRTLGLGLTPLALALCIDRKGEQA